MKKRIGILTFHCAHNYGAVLQTYGLQEQLKLMNFDVEIIDYIPRYLLDPYLAVKPFRTCRTNCLTKSLAYLKFLAKEAPFVPFRLYRRKKFSEFIINRLQLSEERFFRAFDENLKYDFYVIGSDQVWNPDISNGFDTVYFGNFRTGKEAKRISYAASMSKYNLTGQQKAELQNLLANFDRISVREDELGMYLSDNYRIDATTVLDPTLLVTPDLWHSMAEAPRKKKYLLVYTIVLREKTMNIARRIAKERGLEIIEIVADNIVLRDYYTSQTIVCASPGEFVGWFKNADFVVTSSFHGTAFSLIFNKQFWTIGAGDGRDSRIRTLLSHIGLENRLILSEGIRSDETINYVRPNKQLQALRANSVNFLRNNLL